MVTRDKSGDANVVTTAHGLSNTRADSTDDMHAINIVQRGNLKALETTLRKNWRMGQNIVLCWSVDERGLLVIFVPHHFLGNYAASSEPASESGTDNETFIRQLISGRRLKSREELFNIRDRLGVYTTFIKLETPLAEEPQVFSGVEQIIKRYGLSYVENRAVLLFDIVDFSLYTPFEQASQLNSLSYSLNSAYNKLLGQGIEVNFARTTTGDGYYIWNRDLGPEANLNLFVFMLLVVADNAVAQAAAKGNTAPEIRAGYHIGGHYELYQAEGVNPSLFSYIVGDVTIELARMLDIAHASQVLVGDFQYEQRKRSTEESAPISADSFIETCNRKLAAVTGVQLSRKPVNSIGCHLTQVTNEDGSHRPRRIRIVDKHGMQRVAYNLQIEVDIGGDQLQLGLSEEDLVQGGEQMIEKEQREANETDPPSADEAINSLSTMLKRRHGSVTVEK